MANGRRHVVKYQAASVWFPVNGKKQHENRMFLFILAFQ
jgi:hypothetical protein